VSPTPAPEGCEVFVVGSLNADLLLAVEHRPRPGETVLGGDAEQRPGGKGANQAVAAARLGARVAMLGRVGDDPRGRELTEALQAEGIDVSRVLPHPHAASGLAVITITPEGENAIIVAPGANARLSPDDVEEARGAIAAARVLVLQLEVPLATVERAAAVAAEAGVPVVLNLAPAMSVPSALLQRTDVLVVNEHEAGELLSTTIGGAAEAEDRGRELLELGPRAAVVTLGANGAVVVESGGATHVASPRVLVVDTTGAGDAFVGALAVEHARGADLAAATRLAVRAGAAATLSRGAQRALPTRADLEELCDATASSTASSPERSPT
jgi:ribokinase